MDEPLWATGPGEILRHGVQLLEEDTDCNRRLAMIAIDNSVELMLQTYVSLPKRVTGLSITRKERDEIVSGFPKLLNGIEKHAAEKIFGIDLGEIEWFHRLRNELYHQGNGLTVKRSKVEIYAELAKVLFENLFGVVLRIEETKEQHDLGEFMAAWIEIEKKLRELSPDSDRLPTFALVSRLHENGKLSGAEIKELRELQRIRNQVVHGETKPDDVLEQTTIERTKRMSRLIAKTANVAVQLIGG
jgi:hypothetical protein